MLLQVNNVKRVALNFFFPRWCIGCGKEGNYVCDSCRQALTRITPPLCPKCGRPQPSGILCPGCVSWQSDIDGIRSPFRFEGVIRSAIHNFKYRNLRDLTEILAGLLAEYFIAYPLPGEVLVPVPLHQSRLKERGYNQSGLLAQELSKLIRTPVVDDCLVRHKLTAPQARTLNVNERQSNVLGAFNCRNTSVNQKQVILIDDVATSGSTLNACASALKASGAKSVWGLVLAREI